VLNGRSGLGHLVQSQHRRPPAGADARAVDGQTQRVFNGGKLRNRGIENRCRLFDRAKSDLTWIVPLDLLREPELVVALPVPAFPDGAVSARHWAPTEIHRASRPPNRRQEGVVGDGSRGRMSFSSNLTITRVSLG